MEILTLSCKLRLDNNTYTRTNYLNKIVLAPEQSTTCTLQLESEMDKQSISKFISDVETDKNYITFRIEVFYVSELNPSKEYLSWMHVNFYKNKAIIVASDGD